MQNRRTYVGCPGLYCSTRNTLDSLRLRWPDAGSQVPAESTLKLLISLKNWWRRRESNPGPRGASPRSERGPLRKRLSRSCPRNAPLARGLEQPVRTADPQRAMLRRAALSIALALTIPLVGIPCWIALNRQDLPDVDDSDLAIDRPALPADANGFNFLRAAAAASTQSAGSDVHDRLRAILARETSEPGWVNEMMHTNADAFSLLERGLSGSRRRDPRLRLCEGRHGRCLP